MSVWVENVLSLDDVWKLLYKARGWEFDKRRPMHITKNYGYYGDLGAVLFTLEGSPIKAYAVFVVSFPGYMVGSLHVYDATGRKKKTVPAVIIEGLEELENSAIYPEPSRGFLLKQAQKEVF